MVSDYKITMEQAEYEMVCYRRVFNFVRLLDQEKLEKLNAEGLLAAEGGQTKKGRFVHRTFLPGLCGNGSLFTEGRAVQAGIYWR